MTLVFLGVGGNASDTTHLIFSAYEAIAALPGVDTFEYSQLYVTSPVSTIPQPDFLNSVIRLTTSLTAEQLLDALQKIEKELEMKNIIDRFGKLNELNTLSSPILQIIVKRNQR